MGQVAGASRTAQALSRLLISAGEASGDTYAAEIAKLLEPRPKLLEAVGGRKVRETGAAMIADSSGWGAMGVAEAIKVAPRVLAGFREIKWTLSRGKPGVFVPIDFGAFNVRAAKIAKSLGWKVVYFIPPGSWKRTLHARDLPDCTDAVVTPFPWSAQLLNQAGANAHFWGHPLVEMTARVPNPPSRSGTAVLPGSRQAEIGRHLPLAAATLLMEHSPVRIGLAPNVDQSWILDTWRRVSKVPIEQFGTAAEVLKASDRAVVCSGTATLEAALCDCPSVVVYRGSLGQRLEAAIVLRNVPFISLPNILLQKRAVPELLQRNAVPENIRDHLGRLAPRSPGAEQQREAFRQIRELLGDSECLAKTARLIGEFLEG